MAKAYTDIEQSRKLMEFLPLDSADCYWSYDNLQKFHRIEWFEDGYAKHSQLQENDICAWSLDALFDILPKTIGSHSKMMGYFDDAYHCDYLDEDGEGIGLCTTADNLVDAVYEMVLIQQYNITY